MSLKMSKEHYSTLESLINNELTAHPDLVTQYETGQFPRSDRVKCLQDRWAWDLYYRVITRELGSEIDAYLNGDHIHSALKRLCPRIIKRY